MNNWGLPRFAGKPYCLTGVLLCCGGWLGEWILPMYEKIAAFCCACLKNSNYPQSPSKLLKQRNSPAGVEGANAPLIVLFFLRLFINAKIHSFFIFHFSLTKHPPKIARSELKLSCKDGRFLREYRQGRALCNLSCANPARFGRKQR